MYALFLVVLVQNITLCTLQPAVIFRVCLFLFFSCVSVDDSIKLCVLIKYAPVKIESICHSVTYYGCRLGLTVW